MIGRKSRSPHRTSTPGQAGTADKSQLDAERLIEFRVELVYYLLISNTSAGTEHFAQAVFVDADYA